MDLSLTADEGSCYIASAFCYITLQSLPSVPQHEKRGPRLCAFKTAAGKAVFGRPGNVKVF